MTARLSSTEVKKRLQQFSKRFRYAENEQREATMFWAEFYSCFGISAADATVYEKQVRKLDGNVGRIDSFIPGLLIVEHKSRGRDLEAAYEQAEDYFIALKPEERPKYIITSDFARIVIYDLEAKQRNETSIEELPKHASWFKFLLEGKQEAIVEEREIDRNAAYTISKLHEALLRINFKGRDLEVFLTRLLFCLFADDTGIFNENGQFRRFVESAKPDGSDIGQKIGELFEVLNTADDDRYSTLEDNLKAFPYINGNLFAERTRIPVFDSDLRKLLISCATLDWSGISPAIFGAMFQGVLEEHNATEKRQATRRELGAHYTSERNILRVINPLFLENLREEFEASKRTKNKSRLKTLYDKLPTLNFFDPACGCGNFLVIAYRELRKLENDVIAELFDFDRMRGLLDVSTLCRVKLHQFYGIEIDEAAAHIARVALYITDHQMNDLAAERFGYSRATIPLTDNPQVIVENALRVDWNSVLPATQCSFIFGNPPFVGKKMQSKEQKEELLSLFDKTNSASDLDYVSCWYMKSVLYLKNNKDIEVAFVSTNSITQGEQTAILWSALAHHNFSINFAYRTFRWSNEGKGVAGVHCVIIGFSLFDRKVKKIYTVQDSLDAHNIEIANHINLYLVDAPNIYLTARTNPICKSPTIMFGNMANDGGNYLFDTDEMNEFLRREPESKKYFRKFFGAAEFINNTDRWCLWLKDAEPQNLRNMPLVMERISNVKKLRIESSAKPTRDSANRANEFFNTPQPKSGSYVLIPLHSSENREYIPIGFIDSSVICGNANSMIPNATLADFSILTSKMHMAWVRVVCGRLESRFRYSNTIVYNNFIWPSVVNEEQFESLELRAKEILDVRASFSNSSYSDLYDPIVMPIELRKAHEANNKEVDKVYKYTGKDDDASRVSFLFNLYEKETSLLPISMPKRKRVSKHDDRTQELL
jgi:type I restriction-modification system DNA methylase subunit